MSALAFLSFQRVPLGRHGVPVVPTNEERVRAYRAYAPVQFANVPLLESIRAAEYARQAAADSAPTTDQQLEFDL